MNGRAKQMCDHTDRTATGESVCRIPISSNFFKHPSAAFCLDLLNVSISKRLITNYWFRWHRLWPAVHKLTFTENKNYFVRSSCSRICSDNWLKSHLVFPNQLPLFGHSFAFLNILNENKHTRCRKRTGKCKGENDIHKWTNWANDIVFIDSKTIRYQNSAKKEENWPIKRKSITFFRFFTTNRTNDKSLSIRLVEMN